MIGIINYGSGNINAIANIYFRQNIPFSIISNPEELKSVDKYILPGVGDFDVTMMNLNKSGLKEPLDYEVKVSGKYFLGICVGMQILGNKSEEGELPGLGWINGEIKKMNIFSLTNKPYLPHMGWNSIKPNISNPIFSNIDFERGFYFVHSFCFKTESPDNILATTFYGENFPSAIISNNVYGVQFHPEKSHSNGELLLSNFAKL
jgi:glutamine amidotransferase